jgi:hypothetical protein
MSSCAGIGEACVGRISEACVGGGGDGPDRLTSACFAPWGCRTTSSLARSRASGGHTTHESKLGRRRGGGVRLAQAHRKSKRTVTRWPPTEADRSPSSEDRPERRYRRHGASLRGRYHPCVQFRASVSGHISTLRPVGTRASLLCAINGDISEVRWERRLRRTAAQHQ